jgi:uncharacterized protein DUF4238
MTSQAGQRQLKPRQHTVSKFYLRRFSVPSPRKSGPDGFWVYRRGEGAPKWLPWQTVSIHSHFYSYVDDTGIRNPEMEELLAEVESSVAPIVQKLPSVGVVGLAETERRKLIFFVAAAYARTPATRRTVVDGIEKRYLPSKLEEFAADETRLLASIEKYNAAKGGALTVEDARGFLTGILSGEAALSLGDKAQIGFSMMTVVPLCAMFLEMTWRLTEAPIGREFVASDNPVAFASDEGDPSIFKNGSLEVTMPIDPRHCLLATWGGPASDVVYPAEAGWVDDVVRRTTARADTEVYAPRKSVIVAWHLP